MRITKRSRSGELGTRLASGSPANEVNLAQGCWKNTNNGRGNRFEGVFPVNDENKTKLECTFFEGD